MNAAGGGFRSYNAEHRHGGISMLTPASHLRTNFAVKLTLEPLAPQR